MKILLNPRYEHLRDYIVHIDEHFKKEGKDVYTDRNVIRTLDVGGLLLCVKRYAKPSLRGRLAQRTFRSSKGVKAYYRPLDLMERGIESPEPIAYVRYNKGFIDEVSYFICLHSNYKYCLNDVVSMCREEQCKVITAFGQFAAHLHRHGFLHRDFNAANVLFDKINGRYHFALIDTHSIKVGRPISVEKGCFNLKELTPNKDFLKLLVKAYAEARHKDVNQCIEYVQKEIKGYSLRKNIIEKFITYISCLFKGRRR